MRHKPMKLEHLGGAPSSHSTSSSYSYSKRNAPSLDSIFTVFAFSSTVVEHEYKNKLHINNKFLNNVALYVTFLLLKPSICSSYT